MLKKIRTADLRAGMKFSKSVYIDQNNILVAPNVSVKQKDIDRLLAWGIHELETAGDVIDLGEGSDQQDDYADNEVARKEAELKRLVDLQNQERDNRPNKPAVREVEQIAPVKEVDESDLEGLSDMERRYTIWIHSVEQMMNRIRENAHIEIHTVGQLVQEILDAVHDKKSELINILHGYNKGDYLYSHCVNVAIYAAIIGHALHFEKQKLRNLVMGCLLIDVGMVKIPAYIVDKEGKLSPEEYKRIQTHPLHGYKVIVQENGLPHEAGLVVLEHHEQCDGKGYPRGLKAGQISVFGKIGAVVDTYEAMTKRRSYRSEYLSYDAMKSVLSSGQQKFDQEILRTFLRQLGIYPIGSYVQLNNNCVGIVVEADPQLPMRPNIRLLKDEFGDNLMEPEIVKLANEKDLFIVKALNEKELEDISFE